MERDILLKHKIKNAKDIREIASFVFANISSRISSYKIKNSFGISTQNTKRYFDYFSEAFLMRFVPFFSYSVKKQIYNPQKIFSIDTGLRNAVSFKFSDDAGKLLENIVLIELLRKKQEPYYREGKNEIDFILRSGHRVSELINVYFGINFSRYIREQRIDAAKILLEKEPNSTVLAISLETGFKSQSNFYVAFKEITGMSPGAYRKSITE